MIETFPPARYQDYGSNVAPAPELSSGPQIQVITVGSGGLSNLSFTAIPQTYSALEVSIAGRVTSGNFASAYMTINSDTTAANYDSSQDLYASGATTTSAAIASTTSGMHVAYVVGTSSNANAICELRVLIPGYASALHKAVQTQYNGWTNTRRSGTVGGVWLSTAAITQLDFPAPSGSWAEGTVAVLTGR